MMNCHSEIDYQKLDVTSVYVSSTIIAMTNTAYVNQTPH